MGEGSETDHSQPRQDKKRDSRTMMGMSSTNSSEGNSASSPPSQQQPTTSAPVVLLDALPYVDALPEAYEQYALALIEEEMASSSSQSFISTSKRRTLQPMPATQRTELMKHEMETLERSGGSAARGDTPIDAPSVFDNPPSPGEENVDVWKRSVDRARIEYEAERIRLVILRVEKDEQSVLWKEWKTVRQLLLDRWRSSLEREQHAVESINAERQSDQLKQGEQLQILSAQYHDLVQKLDRLRRATDDMSANLAAAKPPLPPT